MVNNQNDIIEVAARGEFNGVEDVVNVFQFQYLTAGTINDQGLADDLIEILETVYSLLDGAMTVLQLFRDLRIFNKTQDRVLGTYPWDTMTAGSDATDPTAPGVGTLVNYSTGVPRVAPRKYYGVFCIDRMDADGTWTAVHTALLASAGAALLGVLTGTLGTYRYGYLSPKTAAFESAQSVTVTDIPCYQRRRKQGRGS